ncbi:unnamed protein product [Rotaria socialis]|uniref:Uncharacterized protein n=2 Tax=Rotaria socialis TaxID=392032 RepID=A0A818ELL8_9BILA|nr:unnamed protein product [Rotaria socialis]
MFIDAPRMKHLDLLHCRLTSFPVSILTLTSLEILNMQYNKLSSLPVTISTDLADLKVLTLASNQLKGNIIQPPLIYLRELDMSSNSLTIVDGIGEYRLLEKLVLDSNAIKSIAVEIMKLSTVLQSLSIRSNQLSSIPHSLTNMRALQYIYATQNYNYDGRYYRQRLFEVTSIRLSI